MLVCGRLIGRPFRKELTYPIRIADWVALGWVAGGILITAFVPRRILENVDKLFLEEITPVGIAGPSIPPETPPGTVPA